MIVNQKAITGMGGLGKTQLAVEFAYRYGSYFRGVHWLNLADPTQLDSEISKCGLEMNLTGWPADQPSQVVLTLNTWKSNGPRLLVLDNFEEVENVHKFLPRLRHSNIRLLITSRRSDWPSSSGLNSHILGLFTPDESVAFLRKTLEERKDKDRDLVTLADRLGHLPLALELASRFLNGHPRLSVDEYLVQAKQAFDHPSMRDWRKDLLAPTAHDLDLQRTFALSWDALTTNETKNTKKKRSWLSRKTSYIMGKSTVKPAETAQIVFLSAGYLAPNTAIPLEIFEKALDITSEACDEGLSILYGLGLLRQSEAQFPNSESPISLPTIHPLLADYARTLASENKEILEKLANGLEKFANEANQTGLPSRFLPLRPHMPIVASFAEEANAQDAGRLWNNYGYHLNNMVADYSSARMAYERALKIEPDNAAYINNLGGAMEAQGDLDSARTMFEHALKIDEAMFGHDHPNVASDINNLGMVMKDQGDLDGARTMFERALKIFEANLGADHPNVATLVNNLGRVMQDQCDLQGARTMFERALKIDEATFGHDHPRVATRVNNLGMVIKALGDLQGARTMFERALKIDEATFGHDHPRVAIRVNNLGMVMKDLGDLDGARTMFERALKILRQFLPPDHANIRIVQENLDALQE